MKKRLKAFFYVFKQSAFNSKYYQDVLKVPFSFSLKYFTSLFLILSLLTSLAASIFIDQQIKPYFQHLENQLPSFYPANLQIEITDGKVKTNVEEPFFIPLKPNLFPEDLEQLMKNMPLQNILVVNTKANPADLNKYQTYALLTNDSLSVLQDKNDIRIFSLNEIKSFTLNQQIVLNAWEKILPYFKWIIPLLILVIFLTVPTITLLSKFIYLALFSIITFLISNLFNIQKLPYHKLLQINLHALTLPTLTIAIFQILGAFPQIPFFQSIILLIFNLIILTSIKPTKAKA